MKTMKANRDHLSVISSNTDSFGTLHVIVYNEITGDRYSIYLDEGEHHQLSTEIQVLAEEHENMSV